MTTLSPQRPSLLHAASRSYFPIAFIARLPFAMMVVGILTLVVASRDSLALGGLTSAAAGLGSALVGPLLGMCADRFGQRIVLIIASIAHTIMLLGFVVVVESPLADPWILVAAVLIGATAPQVAGMSRSRLVAIINTALPAERQAKTLNGTMAYESAADETMFIVGPVIVALLATTLHPAAPMIGAAGLTLAFVTAFALHRTADAARNLDGGHVVQAPLARVFDIRVLLPVFGATGVGLFFGSTLTSLTAFMQASDNPESAGYIYGVMGIGSTVLALAVAWFSPRFTLVWRWLVFAALAFSGALVFATASDLTAVIIGIAITGVGIGPTLVTQFSLGADHSPIGRSATVMTMLGSGIIVGQSSSSAIVGAIGESAGAATAMWSPAVALALVLVAGAWNALVLRQRP